MSEHRRSLSRRRVLQLAGLSSLGLWSGEPLPLFRKAIAQEKSPATVEKRSWQPLNRFSRMVQEFFVEQVRAAEASGLKQKAALQTKEDAQEYVKSVQQKIARCFGPQPERTPLNARVTGVVDRDTYRIEKVIFESRPGFLVTANLYVPQGRAGKLPGVVGSCGHSVNGKAAEAYQSFAQGLARQGYVTLIFDPIGQGERLQYVDEKFQPRRGTGTSEHLHAGNQQFLVGEFFGSWRAWDGIRALDYLLTRDEVDPNHVGITGNSGGGTMTTWLCGLERRWTMAAPSCFVTTFRRNLENELPADTEQCPPLALALGLDHDDFLAAMAPKPVIILAKERDYFDVRGALEAFDRLKRLYTLLEAPDNIQIFVGPTEHGYSIENREAMYRWFNRATKVSEAAAEPKLTIEKDETLWCTPQGQVAGMSSRSVFSFTREKSLTLAKGRKPLAREELQKALTEVLRLPERSEQLPEYRILRGLPSRDYPQPHATTYAVETERDVFALVTRLGDGAHYSRPPQNPGAAILYISHHSADAELRDEPLIKNLLATTPQATLYACDVRGIGESRPETCGTDQFLSPYGSDYFYSSHSLMLDRPYVGQKTHDVLRVLAWLRAAGHREIHLAAFGWGTIAAAFAAVVDGGKDLTQVTLKQGLESFAAIAESEGYNWPLSCFVPAILERLDLPDCYEQLRQQSKLELVEMQGAVRKK